MENGLDGPFLAGYHLRFSDSFFGRRRKLVRALLSYITEKYDINEDTDLIGFCFPVYAFGIPRICKKNMETSLQNILRLQKSFFLLYINSNTEPCLHSYEARV